MFDVKLDIRMSDSEKLLYNIWQELKRINGTKPPETVQLKTEKPKAAKPTANKICKYCGKPHEKPVDYAMCARQHKKK